MKSKPSKRNKKVLNRLNSDNQNMKKHNAKLKEDKFIKSIKEAQKDPKFIKEINRFIKMATSVYRLKDYKILG